MHHWREKAERELIAGLDYACAIRPWRVRLATALPALIGARTLSLLRAAGPEVFGHKVKVSRGGVVKIIASTRSTVHPSHWTLRLASLVACEVRDASRSGGLKPPAN